MRQLCIVSLCTALAGACSSPKLSAEVVGLTADPPALAMGDAWRLAPISAVVTLSNLGRSTRVVTASVTGPFEVDGTEHLVDGHASFPLAIRFPAILAGPAEGELHIESDGEVLVVPLSATAVMPPECPADEPCRASHFDDARGRCEAVQVPDGERCLVGNSCLLGATCQAGECVGTLTPCDDGNACTTDACDAQGDCVHVDKSQACPSPDDGCHV